MTVGRLPSITRSPEAADFGEREVLNSRLEDLVRRAMAERFVRDSLSGFLGHPVAGLVCLILFMGMVPGRGLLIWFGGILAATIVRYAYGRRSRRLEGRPLEGRSLALVGALVAAGAWGAGGVFFGLELPQETLALFLVILAGLVAAATATLVADTSAFYGFSTILLGSIFASVSLRTLGIINPLDLHFGLGLLALILIFWEVMVALYRKTNIQLAHQLQTRLALREAEDQYRGLVESAHDLVWQMDKEGRWTFLNAAAEQIYRVSPDDLIGEVALDLADGDHLEGDFSAFGKVLRGAELVNHETVHRTVDGERRYLSFSARPLRGPLGEILGAQGTARDVSSHVEAREALEEVAGKNSLVRSLINGTEDLIYFKDGQGVYKGCNHRFADHIGMPEEELVGKTDAQLVTSDRAAAYRESDLEALTSWDPVRFEEWVVGPDGKRRLWETVKTVFRHKEGEALGLLGVVRDVTERKEAEERMRGLAEKAERATRMKSAFLANMSHEIRTPLNGVLGMTEILLETKLSSDQEQYLQIIRSSGESLLGVLNDILDISKIEAGHLELEEVSFDLGEQVMGAVSLFNHVAAERGSELILDLRSEVPRGVRGDPIRLRQVLSNLVGNAVKFTSEGQIIVTVAAEAADGDRTEVRFSVKDTGVGIPEDKLQSIFQEFTQADSSTTREYGGTGLGLAISRHLVSLMGGRLGVESQEGRGSEFFFTISFPVDEGWVPDSDTGAGLDLASTRILIVDDVEANRRIFRDFLEGAGAHVHVTQSAEDGLHLLKTLQSQEPFDLAVLDLLMPSRDGFQLAEDIRLDPEIRDLPLLVLTSSSRPGDRKLARRLRINGFLQKPVSRADLLKSVHGILRRRPAGLAETPADGGWEDRADEVRVEAPLGATVGLDILVAEDNRVNQQVARGLLERWGCSVRIAENGLEVLEALEDSVPDLILMDVQMPELDGLEATKRIRKDLRFASVPILALTAHVLPEERQECEDAGMDDYVPKPFKPGQLKDRIEHWAGRMRGGVSGGDMVSGTDSAEGLEVPIEGEDPGGPPVDIEAFRTDMRDAGIESVVEVAVQAYLEETPVRMQNLEQALGAGDMKTVELEAHGMKSSSRNIRANRLADLLQGMETAGKEGRENDARAGLPGLKMAFDEVLDFLRG